MNPVFRGGGFTGSKKFEAPVIAQGMVFYAGICSHWKLCAFPRRINEWPLCTGHGVYTVGKTLCGPKEKYAGACKKMNIFKETQPL